MKQILSVAPVAPDPGICRLTEVPDALHSNLNLH